MDLLDVVRMMCLNNLKEAVEKHLTDYLQSDNVPIVDSFRILNKALEKDFPNLVLTSLVFTENKFDQVLESEDLGKLSPLGLKEIISSPNIDVPEIDIFICPQMLRSDHRELISTRKS